MEAAFALILVCILIALVFWMIVDINSDPCPRPSDMVHPNITARIKRSVRASLANIDHCYNSQTLHFPYDESVLAIRDVVKRAGLPYRIYKTPYGFLIKIKNGGIPIVTYHMPMRRSDESQATP